MRTSHGSGDGNGKTSLHTVFRVRLVDTRRFPCSQIVRSRKGTNDKRTESVRGLSPPGTVYSHLFTPKVHTSNERHPGLKKASPSLDTGRSRLRCVTDGSAHAPFPIRGPGSRHRLPLTTAWFQGRPAITSTDASTRHRGSPRNGLVRTPMRAARATCVSNRQVR